VQRRPAEGSIDSTMISVEPCVIIVREMVAVIA
jgi:hypothetical protein